jgi:hypothetical protein
MTARCIKCKRTDQVYEEGDRNFWCKRCKIVFDDAPDEGGDFSDRNAAARIEREERRRERQHGRR